MSSLIYIDKPDDALLWRAVLVSVVLHAVVVAVYPHLSKIALPRLPERLEIELFSVKAAPPHPTPAVETPAVVEPAKPVMPPITHPQPVPPTVTPKPVLAAPDNSTAEYRVPVQPAPAKVESVAPSPAPIAAPAPAVSSDNALPSNNDASAKDSKPSVASNTSTSKESDELTDSDTDAWGDYGEQLRALVSKSKQYPAIAIRRHLEGEAVVVAQFNKGELVNVSLAGSSAHVPLDEEAMRMVKKAIAQLGVRDSLKKKSFKITIPVSFKLE